MIQNSISAVIFMSRDVKFLSEDRMRNIKSSLLSVVLYTRGIYGFIASYHRSVKRRKVRTYYLLSAYIKGPGINSQDDPYSYDFHTVGAENLTVSCCSGMF